jgi:hypothetical protein
MSVAIEAVCSELTHDGTVVVAVAPRFDVEESVVEAAVEATPAAAAELIAEKTSAFWTDLDCGTMDMVMLLNVFGFVT